MKNWIKIAMVLIVGFVANIPLSMAQSKFNKQPEYPGGTGAMMDFLKQNIKYPVKAREASLEGVVYVNFIVNIDGTLSAVEAKKAQYQKVTVDAQSKKSTATPVANPTNRSLEAEAERVVKAMPKWIAGETDGKKTSIAYMLPIDFNLN
jgi:periplasmic protein TonB